MYHVMYEQQKQYDKCPAFFYFEQPITHLPKVETLNVTSNYNITNNWVLGTENFLGNLHQTKTFNTLNLLCFNTEKIQPS